MITQKFLKVCGRLNDGCYPLFKEKDSDLQFSYVDSNWRIFKDGHCYLIETDDKHMSTSCYCDGYFQIFYKVWDYGTVRHSMHKHPKLILQQDYYNAK